MLKRILLLVLIGAVNSAFGMGYLFEQLGRQEETVPSSESMNPEKKYYLDFKDSLKIKLDKMPKGISANKLDKEKLEELKKVVGINFAREYEAANKKDLESKAYRSIKSKFIADGFSTSEQDERRNDIQSRYSLLLSVINQILKDQPQARL